MICNAYHLQGVDVLWTNMKTNLNRMIVAIMSKSFKIWCKTRLKTSTKQRNGWNMRLTMKKNKSDEKTNAEKKRLMGIVMKSKMNIETRWNNVKKVSSHMETFFIYQSYDKLFYVIKYRGRVYDSKQNKS